MKKRLLSCLLGFMLTLSSLTFAFAESEEADTNIQNKAQSQSFEKEAEYAKDFLLSDGIYADLSNPIVGYNTDLEEEVVSFTVNDKGYIIVDIKDYDVPEYSLTNASPFTDENAKYIYNGPLSYYVMENEKISHLRTGAETTINELPQVYSGSDTKVIEKNESNFEKAKSRSKRSVPKKSCARPPKFDTDHYCGVDGCAILLTYWDDNYDDDIVPTEAEGNEILQTYLLDNHYLIGDGLSGDDIVNGSRKFKTKGLKRYLEDNDVSYYNIRSTTYSFRKCKTQIDKGYILLAGTDEKTGPGIGGEYENHWIIPYDYKTVGRRNYLIINDGWGSDNISVSAQSKYYPWGIVYMYE